MDKWCGVASSAAFRDRANVSLIVAIAAAWCVHSTANVRCLMWGGTWKHGTWGPLSQAYIRAQHCNFRADWRYTFWGCIPSLIAFFTNITEFQSGNPICYRGGFRCLLIRWFCNCIANGCGNFRTVCWYCLRAPMAFLSRQRWACRRDDRRFRTIQICDAISDWHFKMEVKGLCTVSRFFTADTTGQEFCFDLHPWTRSSQVWLHSVCSSSHRYRHWSHATVTVMCLIWLS